MAQAASSAPAQQPPYLGAESIEYGVGKSGVRPRWEYDGHPLWRKDYVWDRPFSSIPLYQPRPQDLIPEKPPRRRWPTRKIFSVAALASMAVKPDPKPEPPPPPPAQLSEFLVVDPPAEEAEPAAPSPAAAVQRVRSATRRPSAVTRPSLTPTLEPEWSTRGSTVIVVEPEPEPVEEPPEPEPPPRARRRGKAKRAKKPKEGKPKKPAPAPRPPPPPPPEPPKLTLLPPPPPPPPKKPEPPPPKKKKVAVVSPPQVAAVAVAAPVVVPELAPEPVVVVPTPPPVEAKTVEEPPVLPPDAEANATPEPPPPPPAPPAPPAEPPPPPPADPPPPPAPEEREEEEGDVVDFFSVQDGEDLLELPASPGPLSPADQKMSFRAPKGPRTVSLESPRDFKPRQRTADAKDPVELALTLKGAAQMVDDFFRDMKGFEKRRKANYASCNVLSEEALEQRRNTPPLRTHRDLLAGMAGEAKVHTAGAARVFAEAAAAAAAAAVASPPSGRPSPRSPLSPSASGEFERRSVSRRQGSPQSSHGSPYGGQRSLGTDTVLTSRSDFGDRTLLETSASAAPLSAMSGTARGDSEFSPQSPHSSAPPRTAPTGLSSSQSGCPPIHTLGGRSLAASAPGAESLAHHSGAQLYLLGPNQHVPPSSPGVLSPLLPQHWPPGAVPRPPDGSRSVTGQIVKTLKAMQLSETQRLKREAYAAMRGAYLAGKRRGAAGACALEPKGCVRLLPDALGPPSSPIVASPTATTSSGPGSSLTVPAAGWLPSVSTPAPRPSRSAQPGKRSAPPSPPFAM